MTRSQNHDDGASSNGKRPKSCAPWSELDHNLLFLVMMQLGFTDFFSFLGVCKSWRSLACENQNKFMESRPPMQMSISCRTKKKTCHVEDFEGRRFKTILPHHTAVDACVGSTCGYLIFFMRKTRDFWLVHPITRKQLHFPNSPFEYHHGRVSGRAILVFSPSISGLVFVALYGNKIWFSVMGNGAWNSVPHSFDIVDLYPFKGKIYILTIGRGTFNNIYELRLSPQPKLILLKFNRRDSYVNGFVSSGENLFAIYWNFKVPFSLHEVDLVEKKWVKACEKTIEEYAFFRCGLNHDVVGVKRESWVDPRSRSHGRFALSGEDGGNIFWTKKMWYFPRECMSVDSIDE